jgi:glutamine cyclotransferase
MKSITTFFIVSTLSFILFFSCGDDKPTFALDEKDLKETYTTADLLKISIKDIKPATVDSIQVVLGDKAFAFKGSKGQIELKDFRFGLQGLSIKVFANGKEENLSAQVQIVSAIQPQLIDYEIVNTFKHDDKAYTQGLEFYNGQLFESTGQLGKSTLRLTDFASGQVKTMENLPVDHFGEGITILNDTIYQLTWQNNKALVYDAKTLKKIKEINYPKIMEGWGLTNDGTHLYMSDGSENLYKLKANTFEIIETIPVYSASQPIKLLNELEWVDGKIYANVYQKDSIVVIEPKTGSIEKIIHLINLKKSIDMRTKDQGNDVLNGIAYHPKRKTFFVTGKNWEKTFEIRLK